MELGDQFSFQFSRCLSLSLSLSLPTYRKVYKDVA